MTEKQHDQAGKVARKFTRGQLLTGAGAGLAAALAPATAGAGSLSVLSFPFFPQVSGRYSTEQIRDILNILLTFEHWRMTNSTGVLQHLDRNSFDPIALSFVQATAAVAVYHADFLESLGARSLSDTFAYRQHLLEQNTYLLHSEFIATFYTATYMTAAREFAELGEPTLVKYAYQMGAVYAEQRALSRAFATSAGLLSENPANNRAFETDHFVYTVDAYNLPKGTNTFAPNPGVPFVGRDAALGAAGPAAALVLQKTPNNARVSTTSQVVIEGERGDSDPT